MHCTCILFIVVLYLSIVCCFKFRANGSDDAGADKNLQPVQQLLNRKKFRSRDDNEKSIDSFTKVALLDIVFQDGKKRRCTGTIIHDNAIITAAHCFVLGYKKKHIRAEISESYIIIGTRMMYEDGSQKHLPIEKILMHPKYTGGWTADLALVFSYGSLANDRPGEIVPLANGNPQDGGDVDANVTVISWGTCPSQAHNSDTEEDGSSERLRIGKKHTEDKSDSDTNKRDIIIESAGPNSTEIFSLKASDLSVEIFNFVHSQTCMKLINKSMPAEFSVSNSNEILCYRNDEHFITADDSGAPALQGNQLLAVTVGGTEWEGDHIGVGLKISSFCPWIARNLPASKNRIQCSNDKTANKTATTQPTTIMTPPPLF